jgi:hypothetical protein
MGLSLAVAHAEGGRIKVAILDGVPVYRWPAFKSAYQDDITRALILRDFRQQGKSLPSHFVDEAIERKINTNFGGEKSKLIETLKRGGDTMRDFRQFIAEEIILQAMRKHESEQFRSEAEWLASLRRGAHIQILKKVDRS